MIEVYEKVLGSGSTAFQTEEFVRERLYNLKSEGSYLSTNEKDELKKKIINGNENVRMKIVQTRVQAKMIIEIKGNLKDTSEVLRTLSERISK